MQLDVATNWVTAAKAMHLTRLSPINKKLTKKKWGKIVKIEEQNIGQLLGGSL